MSRFVGVHIIIGCVLVFGLKLALAQPYFTGNNDPKPAGKKWVKLDTLSDEFDGTILDASKWQNTDAKRWIGRAPGIFKEDVVSLGDGNLRLTNYQLTSPEVVNGNTFTHAGGNLYSKYAGQVGYYYECRMKANKTFMSSTFWLINTRGEGSGCDLRTTELDIQECVGFINNTASWAQSFDETIHSNTHSRNTNCTQTPTGSAGGNAPTSGKVWADYHVYGAWWKTPTEIEFYLDGVKVYTVTPKADFNLPMYLRLVTETYDWNPVPADGGMNGTWEERTTYYDWVRSWALEDDLGTDLANTTPKKSISIFPNPVHDGFVSIDFEGTIKEPSRIKIMDLNGRVQRSLESTQDQVRLSVEGLTPGIYTLWVQADEQIYVQKLVIE